MKHSADKRRILASPYALWIIGFTVLPMFFIFRYALTTSEGTFTFSNIAAIFDSLHLQALIFSLEIALATTAICILLAYPLTLALRHLNFGSRGFMLFILILPMWMNFILRILALQMIISNNGVLNFILTHLGLPPAHIANTPAAIVLGMVYDYLPYMVLPIYNTISEINKDILEASRDLGANGFVSFVKIIFPLSLPGLISGVIMVFVPSMTSFAISDILGGGKLQLIGNVIEQEFMLDYNWNLGSGLSVSLMIFVMLSMIFTMKGNGSEGGGGLW